MGAASDAPSAPIAAGDAAQPEPKRPRFLAFVLMLGMGTAPFRCLAYVIGTPQTQGTPAWFGIPYEALGFYVMLSVWSWRRWAVWVWAANVAVTAALGFAAEDRMSLIQAAVQGAILWFVVRPIWSSFR